jgi:Bacteriophage HK97-gp10, putative tail-component
MLDVTIDSHQVIDECDDLIEALESLPFEQAGQMMEEDIKSKTPVVTGFLRDSNYFYIDGESVIMSNTADYASFVNDGTRYMDAEEFMCVDDVIDEVEDLMVRHLGD